MKRMKTFLVSLACLASVVSAHSQVGLVGAGANCVPWTPVNLTSQTVTVQLIDDMGNPQASYRVAADHDGLRWVWCPTNWYFAFANVTWSPDLSGTNPNVVVFMSNADVSGLQVFVPSGGAPPVSTSNWPDVSWAWFWAGFGLVLSFFSFVWPLRMAKNIGAPNPEM